MLLQTTETTVDGSGRRTSESAGPELAIIIPTFKEKKNLPELVDRLRRTLQPVRWEAIFVDDDSPDGTAECARALGQEDPRIRCIERIGRRGLSSACVEGMLSTSAPFLAVMDADLQHDEALLPEMLKVLKTESVDIVVGSRYVEGGGTGTWDQSRIRKSRLATKIAQRAIQVPLQDPMSGFFALRAELLHRVVRRLSSIGFKILLDILASSKTPLTVKEIPYHFRERTAGESKLDSKVAWDFLMLILDKTIGRAVPVRFFVFMFVGGMGVFVHFAVLSALFAAWKTSFLIGQSAATLAAMTFNFAVNNILTYRDMRLSGWRWLWGWLTFVLACSIGGLANVGIANYLFQQETFWVISAIAGIIVGAVWNYAVTSIYTWRAK